MAVYMEKGWQQVVGCLAAHLAGCPYVPIAVTQPLERIAGILADVGARVVLHDGRVMLRGGVFHDDDVTADWKDKLDALGRGL